jgi:hypothetical protein
MTMTYSAEQLDRALSRLESGDTIVSSPAHHDALIEYLKDSDERRADRFFLECRTWANPQRVGIADALLMSYR